MSDDIFDHSDASAGSAGPSPVSHAEFKCGIGKTVGYFLHDGTFVLRGGAQAVFIAYWFLYAIAPWIIAAYVAYRWHSWSALWGIAASYVGSAIAGKSRQGAFSSFVLMLLAGSFAYLAFHVPFGSWFGTWFNSWPVYFGCCALWGSMWYSIADAAQEQFAMGAITKDEGLYDLAIAKGKLRVFRFGEGEALIAELSSGEHPPAAKSPKGAGDQAISPEAQRMQQQIASVLETIYSEDFEFDAMVERLAPTGKVLSRLRAYIAIEVGTQLKEALAPSDVAYAMQRLKDALACQKQPEFDEILGLHEALATSSWQRRNLLILRGKLANQKDPNSIKGMLYDLEHRNKGPLDAVRRLKADSLAEDVIGLNDQIQERELAHLRESDPEEHARYLKEISRLNDELRSDAEESEESEFEVAGYISDAESRLAALLSKSSGRGSTPESTQSGPVMPSQLATRTTEQTRPTPTWFLCPTCGTSLSMSAEYAGRRLTCKRCGAKMLSPTTVEQAETIVDHISDVLSNMDYVGGTFVPFSKTGACTRLQIAHAIMLATANLYRRIFSHKPNEDELKVWEDFSNGAGGILVRVMHEFFPDIELEVLRKSYTEETRFSGEVMVEKRRLQALAETDQDVRQTERVGSFVSYLQAIDLRSANYWQLVYSRLGLPCPVQRRDS